LDSYPKIRTYMERITEEAKSAGYVETIFHRRRYIPELASKNRNIREFGERIALNTPIQGSAADIIKIAMVRVYNALKSKNMKSKLILQIHDELILDVVPEEEEEVTALLADIMQNAYDLRVPLKVDMNRGKNWYDTK
jgi:DNA polymerase-1